MSLRLLFASLQSGRVVNGTNALVQVVHECIEELAAIEKREDVEVEALKEMIHGLEERSNERIENVRAEGCRQVDVVAQAVDLVGVRVANLEADPR